MLRKIAETIQMSFPMPESEIVLAREIIELLNDLKTVLDANLKHLDIIYEPFEKYQTIPAEKLDKKSGALNRYKEKIKENFENLNKKAFIVLGKMRKFENDGKMSELISAFENSIQDITKQVEETLKTLDDYKSLTFREDLLKVIDLVKTKSESAKELIENRLNEYFTKNVINDNWTSQISQSLQKTIAPHTPMLARLYEEREQAIKNPQKTIDIIKRPQSLSPAMTQQVYYAGDRRESTYKE